MDIFRKRVLESFSKNCADKWSETASSSKSKNGIFRLEVMASVYVRWCFCILKVVLVYRVVKICLHLQQCYLQATLRMDNINESWLSCLFSSLLDFVFRINAAACAEAVEVFWCLPLIWRVLTVRPVAQKKFRLTPGKKTKQKKPTRRRNLF